VAADAVKPPFRQAQGAERGRREIECGKAKMNHGGTERTEIKPSAKTITRAATKKHQPSPRVWPAGKELKENFHVIYVLFCGETAFGFISM
jgi:hypothetical protein